tara:strand:- start:6233 stop:7513 length:1281 start_codon:yes stop_codon:yes gene_type:complete
MRSNLNLRNINRSVTGLANSLKSAKLKSDEISDNLRDRNLKDKEGISMSSKLFARRRDAQRRKEKEELLEASGVVASFRRSRKIIQKKTKGFLGRLLDFVGSLLIGWALLNLPKIIKLVEGTIKRMRQYFAVVSSFITDITTFLTGFRTQLAAAGETLSQFDFEPALKNVQTFMKKVQDAFTQISLNMIKTINKYANKSESEIAKDLGISDLYNRLRGNTDSNAEESVTTDDSLNEVEELDLEASGNLSYMEAVKKAVKDIKERKTIEKEEKKRLDKAMNENDKIYLHTYLENNGYTLVKIPGKGYRYFPNEGIMDIYGDLLDKNNVERIPVPFGEQGTENEKTGADFLKDLENNAKFEGEKKDLNKLNPVEDNNNTTIVIPPAKNNNNKQYFEEEGFIDLLGGDSSVNNSNIKIKDACLLKMDGC